MNAIVLIQEEKFYYSDCILINDSEVVGFNVNTDRVEIDRRICIDKSNIINIFQNFATELNGSHYVGGESSAHGSCGFFYKRTDNFLDWALMSTQSNPFIAVEILLGKVRFLSSAGSAWVVPDDDINKVYIEE